MLPTDSCPSSVREGPGFSQLDVGPYSQFEYWSRFTLLFGVGSMGFTSEDTNTRCYEPMALYYVFMYMIMRYM